ncbi:MAG: hypothetical protein WBV60_05600, partial [Terriglobales bacterium]
TSICRSIVTICSGLYLWMGMTRFSSKWILSHSTWYKFRRSGHPALSPSEMLPTIAAFAKLIPAVLAAGRVAHKDGD